jgi:DNA-binding beta-propeller fold protein YncE
VSNIPADTDAIIIMGDCNSALFMDVSQAYSTNPGEWGGRWNLALDAIKRSFPTVPVFLVYEWVGSMSGKSTKNGPEAFWRFANNHGCIFVNLQTESPLNLRYAAQVWGLNDNDAVHTSHEAMPLFADVIIRHLRQIPPPVWQGFDTIAIAESSVEVQVGKTVNLTVTKTGDLSSQWTSDNMDVACVLGGVVYGMAAGTATITATTRNGNTASCAVTVIEMTTA